MRCLLALSITACQDYGFAPVCPHSIEESELSTTPIRPSPADILFVVDNSGSMADEQARLAANFGAFIDEISQSNADYRIAVVSTDLSSSLGERAGEVTLDWDEAEPFELITTNGNRPGEPGVCSEVGIEHGCFRGPEPALRIIDSTMVREQQIEAFTANVSIGSCGSGSEEGLAAAVEALDRAGANECNGGFLRDRSNLVLIFLTDEEDASPGSVETYVAALGRHKPWANIRAAAIVASAEGRASGCKPVGGAASAACGSLCSACPGASWCGDVQAALWQNGGCAFCSHYAAADCCTAIGGARYQAFLEQVDANVRRSAPDVETATILDSICQDSFQETLQKIGRELIVTSCFDLDPAPSNPDGIAVRVQDGRTLERGTDFTLAERGGRHQVCVEPGALFPNERIEVFFVTGVETRPSIHPSCP
jgi:hypothetical protein